MTNTFSNSTSQTLYLGAQYYRGSEDDYYRQQYIKIGHPDNSVTVQVSSNNGSSYSNLAKTGNIWGGADTRGKEQWTTLIFKANGYSNFTLSIHWPAS